MERQPVAEAGSRAAGGGKLRVADLRRRWEVTVDVIDLLLEASVQHLIRLPKDSDNRMFFQDGMFFQHRAGWFLYVVEGIQRICTLVQMPSALVGDMHDS